MRKAFVRLASFFIIFDLLNVAFAAAPEIGLVTSIDGDAEIFVKALDASLAPEKKALWKHIKYLDAPYFAKPAEIGDRVPVGSVLHTKSGGKIRFVYQDGDQVNIGPGTSLVVESRTFEGKRKKTLLNILYGRSRAVVKKADEQDKGEKSETDNAGKDSGKQSSNQNVFEVRSRTMVAGVRGTDFTVSYSPTAEKAEVSVLRGSVEMKLDGSEAKAEVKGGYSASTHVPAVTEPKSATAAAASPKDASSKPTPDQPATPPAVVFELKKTTKEDLASILVFSQTKPKDEELKALPQQVAEEIKKAETKATEAVLADIRAVDPGLHARLMNEKSASAADLNAAVIGQQIQTAPAAEPKKKKLLKEVKDLDEGIYRKYFNVE